MAGALFPKLTVGHVSIAPNEQAAREWLFSESSTDRVEELLKEHPYQFASLAPEWESLKRMLQEGDQLWLWSVFLHRVEQFAIEGYAIVRGGKVIATLTLPERTPLDVITGRSHQVPRDWLEQKVTVDEVDGQLKDGGLADQWTAMKKLFGSSDELWSFCSSPDSWAHLAGRAGYALVRDGQVIATIVTMLN